MSTYVHAVFFTCHPQTPPATIQAMIADGRSMLTRIPATRQLHIGPRDVSVNREVSDTEFHVGLLVLFDDKAGYDSYSAHPEHVAFVQKHKPHWSRLDVCDYIAD